jgi:hypothetical protein
MEKSIAVVPEVRADHAAPPFVVFRMVPTSPATYPVTASTGKLIE